ncbi:NYN domain-containing protein [Chloroflexus sp.]|uniref:NYN domain-containing protein n=1 Tax=Chloroflexus sp. TaxID=1904827 RepID=UPI002ADDE5FC|nr:NYN domain-containing protein [Chloroflexus sp.]
MYDQKRPDVAVFIDFENIYVSVRDKLNATPNFEAIMDRCNDLGRVVISRAYADWYRYPRITSALYANAIEPIYVATYYYDKDAGRTGRAIKNSVDMNLCIDAMKTLYTNPNVARFVLVTGDRDFIPLVHSIRQHGKEVYIIGIGGAASTHLAQSADEFVFYEQLIGRQPNASAAATAIANRATELNRALEMVEAEPSPAPAVAPLPSEPDIYDVLVQAIHLARKRGYVTTLGSLKMLMKELMGGDFKENRYRDLNGRPFSKFKDLVMDAEQRGKVQIFTKGSVNEVFLPGEDPMKLSRFAPALMEELPPEPVVIDPPIGSNGSIQIAEISPVVVEEIKTVVPEPAPTTTTASNRRRRRRSRRSARQREEHTVIQETTEVVVELDEPEYNPPLIDEPTPISVETPVTVELGAEPLPVPAELVVEALPATVEATSEISRSEQPATPSRSRRRRSRKATADSGEEAGTSASESTDDAGLTAAPAVVDLPPAPTEPAGDLAMTVPAADTDSSESADDAGLTVAPAVVEPSTPLLEPAGDLAMTTPAAESGSEAVMAPTAEVEPSAGIPTVEDGIGQGDLSVVFSEAEWNLLREAVRELGKPATFQQLLSALQAARRQHGLPRTTEENRTMLKQAIHHGMFERTTRSRRVYYTLKTSE